MNNNNCSINNDGNKNNNTESMIMKNKNVNNISDSK